MSAARRERLDAFAREHASHTPPGAMLVAVLLAAGAPMPSRLARAAVMVALPSCNAREWGRDLNHARASGIMIDDIDADEWSAGPRIGAIVIPADGPHMAAARDALDEAREALLLALGARVD